MADIGTAAITQNPENGKYDGKGEITSLQFTSEFKIEPDETGTGDNSPTHKLFMKAIDSGKYIGVGSAWEKTLERGEHAGLEMFNLNFDEPSLPEWMSNIAAFPTDRDGNYTLVASRKRKAA